MEVDVDDTDSARQDVSKQLPGSTSLKKESTQQLTCAQLFSQTQKTGIVCINYRPFCIDFNLESKTSLKIVK